MKLPENHIFLVVNDLARLLRTRADQLARARGMTRAQWVILRRLQREPGLSQNDLAALAEVEPITVGRLIDRLQLRGLVERRSDPNDRRVYRLHLTPAAAPILNEIGAQIEELYDAVCRDVDPGTLDKVMDCLMQMKANLNAEMRSPAQSTGGAA